MTPHPDNGLGSGSGSGSKWNSVPTTPPTNLNIMTKQGVCIQQLAKKALHEKRSALLRKLSKVSRDKYKADKNKYKAGKKKYKASKGLSTHQTLQLAYVTRDHQKFQEVYAAEAELRNTVHEVVPLKSLQECQDMIDYTCHKSLQKAMHYFVDARKTYTEYRARNPPSTPSPLYDKDIQDTFEERQRLRYFGPRNWRMRRNPQLFFDPSPEAIKDKKRLRKMSRREKEDREYSKSREVPESVQEIARTSMGSRLHSPALSGPTPEFMFSATGTPLPGLLRGPFSLGWDSLEDTGDCGMLDHDGGVSKTFGLIDFPHLLKTKSPVDIARNLSQDEAFKHDEILNCMNEGGHFATTAHTYVSLQKEIFLQFARRGGFNDIVGGAVDTRQLIDFTAGNKYHGRICPLWLRVRSGPETDKFESLPHASDGSGQDSDNGDEDGNSGGGEYDDIDSVENLVKCGTIQYGRYIDFGELSSSSSKDPMHHPHHTRWTSVTPEGMLVPTHNPDCLDLLVDIQVKSYSLADRALFVASGIHSDILGSLKNIYHGLEAQEMGITGVTQDLSWDEFLAQSTILAVRVVGSMHQAEGEKQRCPFLIGMGGWVSPPRFLRYYYEHCKMAEGISSGSSNTTTSGASMASVGSEAAKHVEAAELELLSDPDTTSRAFAAETTVGKMFPLVIPDTLLETSKAARYKDLIEPLMKEVDKQRAFAHTTSTLVRPSDITKAKDLPQANKSALRDSPQSIQDEIDRKVVFDEEEAVPVWDKLADPALDDVMWMVHRLMTKSGISYFPKGRSDFGINWSIHCNKSSGQQKLWEQTCAFKSPSPMAEAHSRMLFTAYKDDVLGLKSLSRPQLPRPSQSDLWKATSPMHSWSVEKLTAYTNKCRVGIEPSAETAKLENLMYRLYTTSKAPADGTYDWDDSGHEMAYADEEDTDDE